VQAAGGAKMVAGKLWPSKPIEQARKDLLDCLNRDNDRKLCVEEVLALLRMAREAGYHGAKHWIDDELGYQPTPPQDPKIERDRLADELARAADNFKSLERAVERLPSGAFARFWTAWPKSDRKAARGKCEQLWRRGGFDASAEQIVAHVEAMKSSIDWRKESGAYIPAPLVYLNQRRWEGADNRPSAPELRLAI
jgi:hypothetical protein